MSGKHQVGIDISIYIICFFFKLYFYFLFLSLRKLSQTFHSSKHVTTIHFHINFKLHFISSFLNSSSLNKISYSIRTLNCQNKFFLPNKTPIGTLNFEIVPKYTNPQEYQFWNQQYTDLISFERITWENSNSLWLWISRNFETTSPNSKVILSSKTNEAPTFNMWSFKEVKNNNPFKRKPLISKDRTII